jgi:uncharacterized membrane protein YbaN (DUF454 family)
MAEDFSSSTKIVRNKFVRSLLLASGFLLSFLALLGAILPLVPTTPFLIAAAACFYRSSPRFYNLMMNNRYFGQTLLDYKAGKGISLKVKIVSLAFLWISSLGSIVFFIPFLWLKIAITVMVIGVTVHIYMIRTKTDA